MKNVQLVIMVLAAIFAMSAFCVDARLKQQLVLKALGINTVSSHPGGEKWCDNCACTKSIPPICWCNDVRETCYDACELCACTLPLGIPPICRCLDIKDYCVYDVAEKPE